MWVNYFAKKNFSPKIDVNPSVNLGLCVVIPCFNEPNLIKSLESIAKCNLPACDVEVIVVVNFPEGSGQEVLENSNKSFNVVLEANHLWGSGRLRFHAVKAFNLPCKQAGVGYARQIGMDEAAFRLLTVGAKQGIIACFDADSQCMPNYLAELYELWMKQPKTHACSVRYEHPLTGDEFPAEVYNGIAAYELHLRYYNQASRFIGFPFAYHTVGSSMACSVEAYVKFGGMNRHQAGEDFYFLQKIIPHGYFRELDTTCVYPSPRPSNRVPFGTGRAMSKLVYSQEPISTYRLESFLNLEPLFQNVNNFYEHSNAQTKRVIESLAQPLSDFLFQVDAIKAIENVRTNVSSPKTFKKRFFLWFDAFMLLKYMNFAAEKYYGRQPVEEQAINLLTFMGKYQTDKLNTKELLLLYREMERLEWSIKL
ncbi:MAG TPA: glycosyltransferase family 2 protein [Bacteroidales bacterium]|nr:glycosyltransferase family 2 protein [Bacteroidales bacterium]